MRTQPSHTAHQPDDGTASQNLTTSTCRVSALTSTAVTGGEAQKRTPTEAALRALQASAESSGYSVAGATADDDEALLHDAGNLIGAIDLYCDLLSMPHVLRPEHRRYAEELRLLGERSAAMIERLLGAARQAPSSSIHEDQRQRGWTGASVRPAYRSAERIEGLRPAVLSCATLLTLIAQEHAVEIAYGDAAALPVCIPAESVERILINLVRNATSALHGMCGLIRIGVGLLPGDGGGTPRPWPFQRVQLMVEDSGRGMAPDEVNELLAGRAPLTARHGIGFRVVRELVEMSGGELSIASAPGRGTRVEMEWPVAQPLKEIQTHLEAPPPAEERRRAA